MFVLDDIIDDNVKLLFCGYSVGKDSKKARHYFANKGNKFWEILHDTGLTPNRFDCLDDEKLPEHNIGITDLLKHSVHRKPNPPPTAEDCERLKNLIGEYKPALVAFTGKKQARAFFKHCNWIMLKDWGMIRRATDADNVEFWLVPDTSSSNNGHFKRLKPHWFDLAKRFEDLKWTEMR